MSTIEERVVAMKFDNKNFQTNVKDSVKSLSELKEGLNLDASTKSLADLYVAGQSFNLAGVGGAVDGLSQRFASLGIVGMSVINNLTTGALKMGKSLVSALTDPIVEGGKKRALDIAQAKFQFEGLGMDVQDTMASANDAVTGTAYSLADAAKVAGQFGASGMRAGKEMTSSLRAIAGVAAMTSDSYESIGSIFTTVAGNGRLMGMQLLQLSNKGVNAAAILGESMGKTEAEVREMVTAGKVDFKTFSDAMDEAFGEHASKANDLFTGSLANVRSALGRIGAEIQAVKYDNFRDMLNAIRPKINDLKDSLMPLIKAYNAFHTAITKKIIIKIDALNLVALNPIFRSIQNAASGLMSILKPIKEAFKNVFPGITLTKFVSFGVALERITEKFKIGEKTAEKIRATFEGLFSVISIGIQVVSTLVKGIMTLFNIIVPAGGGVLYLTGALGGFLSGLNSSIKASGIFNTMLASMKKVVNQIASVFDRAGSNAAPFAKVLEFMMKIGSKIISVSKAVVKGINDILKGANFEQVLKTINLAALGGVLIGIMNFFDTFSNFVLTGGGTFTKANKMFWDLKQTLGVYQNTLKAGILMKIAAAIAVLVVSVLILSHIDTNKLGTAIVALGALFAELMFAMGAFSKAAMGTGVLKMYAISGVMQAMAVAVLVLAGAMRVIAKLDWEEIAKGLVSIGALMGILIASAKLLSMKSGAMIKGALGFVIFAGAIRVLVSSVKALGELDLISLGKGLGAVAVLAGELVLFSKFVDAGGLSLRTGASILLLAAGLRVMAEAVTKLSVISIEGLVKGLGSVAILLATLAGFEKISGSGSISTAVSLVIIGGALLIFGKAIAQLGGLSIETLAKGLVSMAIALGLIAATMKLLTGGIPGAIALAIISGALIGLAAALKMLGSMSLKEIGLSLLALAGVFTVIGVAALALTPLIPSLVLIAGALGVIGLGTLALGAGLLLFSAGLTALSLSGVAGVTALTFMVTELIGLIPTTLKAIAEGLVQMAITIGEQANVVAKAGVKIILEFLRTLFEAMPELIEMGMLYIVSFLKGIADNIGKVVDTATELIVNFLNAIADSIPDIVQAGFNLIVEFVDGLAKAIDDNAARLGDAMFDLGGSLVTGLVKGILGAGVKKVGEAVKGLGNAITGIFKKKMDINSPSGVMEDLGIDTVDGLVKALVDKVPDVEDASSGLGDAVLTGVETVPDQMKDAGTLAGEAYAEGLSDAMKDILTANIRLANQITADVSSGALSNQYWKEAADRKNGLAFLDSEMQSMTDAEAERYWKSGGGEQGTNTVLKMRDLADSLSTATDTVESISNTLAAGMVSDNDASTGGVVTNQTTFVQNNYSPSELSRLEIYRQTKNQFSAWTEGVLG